MPDYFWTILAIVGLLVANAFFVAAEFALVKVRGFQLDQAAQAGSRAARLTLKMHANMDPYLAACQLGITMASLGLGWIGEPAVSALLEPAFAALQLSPETAHTVAFLIGFLLFSSLHIVLGEQVPKTYAIRRPAPVSVALAAPLQLFFWLVYPLNWLLDQANAWVLRALKVDDVPHHDVITEDEISAIVDRSEAHGEIENQTADIIRQAFDFDDKTVRDVMIPWRNVATLELESTGDANRGVILGSPHTRFPVLDRRGNLAGVFATKDLTAALMQGEEAPWRHLAPHLRKPIVAPDTLLIAVLLERMRETRDHLAVVVNEYGAYVGVITLEDIIEEIVGEIHDEWDEPVANEPVELTPGNWRMVGEWPLADVSRLTGLDANGAQSRTIGGLVMEMLERVPEEGDQFRVGSHQIRVGPTDGPRVLAVEVMLDEQQD